MDTIKVILKSLKAACSTVLTSIRTRNAEAHKSEIILTGNLLFAQIA